jgi:hypothetical protein
MRPVASGPFLFDTSEESWLASRARGRQREGTEAARIAYPSVIEPVAGAIHPPPAVSPHRLAESRQERLVRWRFDCMIAATALVAGVALIHHNPADLESIRGAIEMSPERFPGLGPLELIRCESLV